MAQPYFNSKMLTFFRQLEKNNQREWFTLRKEIFEEHVRGPMVALVGDLCKDLTKFAVDLVPPEPAKALYRIYRDTRFSKDKTPYKLHIAAHFQHQKLPKNRAAGLYVALSHKQVEIAGGIYMPGPDEMLAMRHAIAKDFKTFQNLLTDPKLTRAMGKMQGESAKRVPAPFPSDHPAADLIRRKQIYFYAELPADLALKPDLRKQIIDRFKRLNPLVEFFNDAIVQTLKSAEPERPKRPEPMF